MRVIVDPNVYNSYLLSPLSPQGPATITLAGFGGEFTSLINKIMMDELIAAVAKKPYLRDRIDAGDLSRFVRLLRTSSESLSELHGPFPRVCRDPADDYLIAHALVDRADLIVSGDKDLLALNGMGSIVVLSPTAFIRLLEERRTPPSR